MMNQFPKTLPGFFWYFIKQEWKALLLAQVLYFGWTIDQTLWPVVQMTLIDAISNFSGDRSHAFSLLATPLTYGASLWLLVETCFRLSGITMAWLLPRLEASIRMKMFDYVQYHSYSYFGSHMAGSLSNKISDMPKAFTDVLLKIMALFLPFTAAFLFAALLFAKVHFQFALILLSWVFVHMAICIFNAKKCIRASDIHGESLSALSGKVVDSLSNSQNVRLFASHAQELAYLTLAQNEEQTKNWQQLWLVEKVKLALGVACFLGAGVSMMYWVIHQWQHNALTTGEVIFIITTTWNITMMAWIAGLELPQLFKQLGVCEQAFAIVRDDHEIQDAPLSSDLVVKTGEIAFEKVTFSHRPGSTLFQDKSLLIKGGEKIGLVGFTGAGKSTFVHLILRYFELNGGSISIDGQNIATVTQSSLRQAISVIPQEPMLFHRTVIENIRYGKPDATLEEVIAAAKRAQCHEFIEKMEFGYDTLVGERGIKLSGGQRQRIAIARAVLKNAPILILDEATSALDSVTEKKIQDTIRELMADKTTIIIAHRLSTLAEVDRILVFKDGTIIEEGSHQALLDKQGHYNRLWQMQTGGQIPDSLAGHL
ncbi:MAG: putative transporter, ATPase and permease component [Chlamydiales bacterium]|jgi:ATP-binding cassette subfamily B protein|nr:putative transporter, ATPase and permease component [Chlamydiales bacterium]